jgi:tRNASer (uridine44-2'-O)-methyltransferase
MRSNTKNWAIVGEFERLFLSLLVEAALIEGVRKRGQFRTRRPEGKAGDH